MEQPSESRTRAKHALDDDPAPALPTSAPAMNPVSRRLITARMIAQTLWALAIAGLSLIHI